MASKRIISVIGLGYVGLPIAVAFSHKYPVIGFDNNATRISELRQNLDRTGEVSQEELRAAEIKFTHESLDLKEANFHIVAVPTPIDHAKQPDLTMLYAATETVAKQLKKNAIVVYESTVYPGTTEEECIPLLEKISGLQSGIDFKVGYAPERINPGEKQHSFTKITKVVAGQDQESLQTIADIYSSVVTAGVHRAPSIKVAEAAKVIENTQRDINIALMNELAMIFNAMAIDTHEVLAAANTKWNFVPFTPGLVGGHCIGVDPYYLTYKAQQLDYHPEIILAGRRINDNMGKFIAEQTIQQMIHAGSAIKNTKVAILGMTFKENCADIRNSRVIDIINTLKAYSVQPLVHDPLVNADSAKQTYDIELHDWRQIHAVDAIIISVAHDQFRNLSATDFTNKFNKTPLIIDVKSILDRKAFAQAGIQIWRL